MTKNDKQAIKKFKAELHFLHKKEYGIIKIL